MEPIVRHATRVVGVRRLAGMVGAAGPVLGWVGLGLAAGAAAIYALSFALNHDVGWWVYVAGSMLDGEKLYTSLIEVNPPLYGYLVMLPAAVAQRTGWGVEAVVEVWVLGLAFGAGVWSIMLSEPRRDWLLGVVFGGALVVSFLLVPGVDWGQREHIMLMGVCPYAVVLWRRVEGRDVGRWVAVATGLAAAIGIALKPHFGLIWLGLEGWALWELRRQGGSRPRPETVTIGAFLASYVVLVALVYPQYFSLLWAVRDIYGRYLTKGMLTVLLNGQIGLVAAGVVASLCLRNPGARLGRAFVVVMASSWFILVLQAKGWSYHSYPGLAAGTLATPLFCLAAVRAARGRAGRLPLREIAGPLTMAGVLVLLLAGRMRAHIWFRPHRAVQLEQMTRFVREYTAEGDGILILSDRIEYHFPLVNHTGVAWASPDPHLWWVNALYEGTSPDSLHGHEQAGPLERDFRRRQVDSFLDVAPTLVLIDTADAVIDYEEYFRADADFAAEWLHYERAGAIGGLQAWTRRPPAPEDSSSRGPQAE